MKMTTKIIRDVFGVDQIWRQIIVILAVSMVSFTYGLLIAWSSPFLVKITQDKDNYNISEDEASYFTLIPPITMITFCPLFAKMNDLFGRKRCLQLMIIPYIISFGLTAIATNVYVFYLSRFLSGLGDACHFATVPMYIGEITTPNVRGTWGNLISGSLFFGQFCINLIGQNFSVWISAYICLTVPVTFLVISFFLPESPYYCLMKNRLDEAKKSLQVLRGDTCSNQDVQKLQLDVERQMSERGRCVDLFMIKSNRRAFLGGAFLRLSQQFAGITIFSVYVQFIFEKSGSIVDPKLSTLIVCFIMFFVTFVSGFIVENFGRKKTFTFSLAVCALMLLADGTYFFLDQISDIDLTTISWLPLVFTVVYIVFCSFGIAMLPTLMLGEIFSASIKAYGLSFLSFGLGALQFLTNAIFYQLNSKFGLYAPFLFFGCCTVFSSLVSPRLVPETKGKTLEEIQQAFKDGSMNKKPKKNVDVEI